jgi:hypothetical protein
MKGTVEERVALIEDFLGITEDTTARGDTPTLRKSLAGLMKDFYELYERVCKLEKALVSLTPWDEDGRRVSAIYPGKDTLLEALEGHVGEMVERAIALRMKMGGVS